MKTQSSFASWSPVEIVLPKTLYIDPSTALASSGELGSSNTFWSSGASSSSSSSSSSKWSLKISCPSGGAHVVSAVKVSWRFSTYTETYAPRTLSVQCNTHSGDGYMCAGVYDVEQVGRCLGDWHHVYEFDKDKQVRTEGSCIDVKLVMSGFASCNYSNEVRIFSIDIITGYENCA